MVFDKIKEKLENAYAYANGSWGIAARAIVYPSVIGISGSLGNVFPGIVSIVAFEGLMQPHGHRRIRELNKKPTYYIHIDSLRGGARHLRNERPINEKIITVSGEDYITYATSTKPEKILIQASHILGNPIYPERKISEIVVAGRVENLRFWRNPRTENYWTFIKKVRPSWISEKKIHDVKKVAAKAHDKDIEMVRFW